MGIKKEHVVVCLGASIMRGQVSSNFVGDLEVRMGKDGFRFINHAVAGYEAYNVLVNLDATIDIQPDYVIILVGTNDVTASLSPGVSRISRLMKKIPEPHSTAFYRKNMSQIVHKLKKSTMARIGIVSLPVLGEDLETTPNLRIREYNAVLKDIANREQVSYLPVYEQQEAYLKQNQDHAGREYRGGVKTSLVMLILHFLFRQSFDTISKKNGYTLLTDGIHMNSKGAKFIADEIELFLREDE